MRAQEERMEADVGVLTVTFPEDSKVEVTECPDWTCWSVRLDGVTYDVIANRHIGERLVISGPDPHWSRDVPLGPRTAHLLPDGFSVKVRVPAA